MAMLFTRSLFFTAVIVGAIFKQSHAETPNNVCNTDVCNESAAEILSNMDNSVDPCDNFYKFSCGGFLKRHNIPDDKQVVDVANLVSENIAVQLKSILEEPGPPNERKPFKLARNLYEACMNEAAIETKGREYLQEKLQELGGWPVLDGDQWDETNFQWTESVRKFRNAGYPETVFLNVDITLDLMDGSKKILDLDQPNINHETLKAGIEDTAVNKYYKYMVDIAVILGAPRDRATAQLEETLKFETALAKICVSHEERRNRTQRSNVMTVAELSEKYPSVPWKQYLNNILAPYVTIEDDERVNVQVPSFISKFVKLMSNTPKKVQANYAMWKAVEHSVSYLTSEMQNRLLEYGKQLIGVIALKPRWQTCIQSAKVLFSTHTLYIRKYFSAAARNNAAEITIDIKEQFDKILKKVDWMDEETKNNAIEKNNAISSFVGYPDELLDDDIIEELYKNLEFHDDNYLENQLNLDRYLTDELYSNFRKPINKNEWRGHGNVAIVNAFYKRRENTIDLPAGLFQGIFFNTDRPKYMNYGAVGSIIGHEITHAFDNIGRQFDKVGDVRNWWSPTTTQNFHNKLQCIVDQYGNYTVEEVGKKLNGIQTEDENIADNGGFKIAYMAYNEWAERHEVEPTLPGLQYTPKQMFWISAANPYCTKYRPQYLETMIDGNPHSTEEFRIIGSFSNRPEFAQDFNCPVGSKMNPENKCKFW